MSFFNFTSTNDEIRENPSNSNQIEIYYFKDASVTQNMDVLYQNGKAFNNHILKGIIKQHTTRTS